MTRWKQVMWTDASQIGQLLGWPPLEGRGVAPSEYFSTLRAEGRDQDAALFLGQSLPRLEGIAWAARVVRDLTPDGADAQDLDALKSVFLWLQDPTDARRRAAFEASGGTGDTTPQKLCALAVFFSGGSLAPDDVQPVPAPKAAAGKFAAGAILMAATQSPDRTAALNAAFALGEAMAIDGPQGAT